MSSEVIRSLLECPFSIPLQLQGFSSSLSHINYHWYTISNPPSMPVIPNPNLFLILNGSSKPTGTVAQETDDWIMMNKGWISLLIWY